MDPGLLLLLGGGAALSLGGGWVCISRWSRIRHMQDTPTSRIRSAAQGYVELVGVLQPLGEVSLTAPLTGEPCLWWRYRIEEYRSSGKRSSWRVIERGVSDGWLRLADATGECLIDPKGAEVRPSFRRVWSGSRRHPRGMPLGGWRGLLEIGRKYRYCEERLHAGEPLYAIGDFRTVGGGRQGLDLVRARKQVISEWKGEYAGLLQRFDSNHDGQLDEAEWHRVRLAAGLEAEERHRHTSDTPAQHRLMRPAERLPFVLSSHGEEVLARRYRWQAVGGALLCLAGALLLSAKLA